MLRVLDAIVATMWGGGRGCGGKGCRRGQGGVNKLYLLNRGVGVSGLCWDSLKSGARQKIVFLAYIML